MDARRSGGATASTKRPARRPQGRVCRTRVWRRRTWSWSRRSSSRRASSIPKNPAGAADSPPERDRPTRRNRIPMRRPIRAQRTCSASPTPTSRSPARMSSSAAFTASTPTTSRTRRKPQLLASVVCPGGQGDVSVHGNLLFMSVEQTRGRLDCGTQGVQDEGERRAVPRRPDLRHQRSEEAEAGRRGANLPRVAYAHARDDPKRSRPTSTSTDPAPAPSGRPRSSPAVPDRNPKDDPEHVALQHRRDRGAARGAREGRRSSTGRASSPTRRPATSPACGRAAITAPGTQKTSVTNQCHDITVFPEIGLAAGACSGNGILLDISDPVHPVRLDHGERQELRLLAFGDVQQRRHEGHLHRRVGRRHAAPLPRDRSRSTGAPTPSSTSSTTSCSSAATTRCRRRRPTGELRRAQRLARSRARARHHGAGLVPGRRVGVRFHRLGASGRDRVLRSRTDRREAADHRRLLVGLLVQRPHLRLRDRARHRRLQADAERIPVAERNRRGDCRCAPTSSTRSSRPA